MGEVHEFTAGVQWRSATEDFGRPSAGRVLAVGEHRYEVVAALSVRSSPLRMLVTFRGPGPPFERLVLSKDTYWVDERPEDVADGAQ
jgi:hypothetical protein